MRRIISRISIRSTSSVKELPDSFIQNLEDHLTTHFASLSKKGKDHANEDRVLMLQQLSDTLPSTSSSSLSTTDSEEESKVSEDDVLTESNPPISKDGEFPVPKVQLVAVFDGHGGDECVDFLTESLAPALRKCARQARCQQFKDLMFVLPEAFLSLDREFYHHEPDSGAGACGVVILVHEL